MPSVELGQGSEELQAGRDVVLPMIRPRPLSGSEWWQDLTLDPESLTAAWARPRPLRPRPDRAAFESALREVNPSESELGLLRCHARSPRRSATMRTLAREALSSDAPGTANLLYGRLARRLCEATRWEPDRREDKSPIWMSTVAEGWQPPEREFEWVLIPALAQLLG